MRVAQSWNLAEPWPALLFEVEPYVAKRTECSALRSEPMHACIARMLDPDHNHSPPVRLVCGNPWSGSRNSGGCVSRPEMSVLVMERGAAPGRADHRFLVGGATVANSSNSRRIFRM